MIASTLSSALMGLQRYDITAKIAVVVNTILTIVITILVLIGYGLKEVIYMNVLSSAVLLVITYVTTKRTLPRWKPMILDFEKSFFLKMFNFSGYMFVSKISSLFNNYIVRFIISAVLGPAALTFYVIPTKILNAFSGLLSSLTTVLFPFASELKAADNKEKLHSIYIKGSKYLTTFAFPVYLLLIAFSKEILTIWMGPEFAAQGWIVMSILAAANFLSACTMVPANLTFGLGYSRVIAFFSILVLFLGITFVMPLAKLYGIIGAALGILISQFVVPFFILYVTTKIIRYPVTGFVKGVLIYHVAGLAASLVGFYLFHTFMHNTSIPVLLLFFAFFIIIYYFSCILLKWVPIGDVKKMLLGSKVRVIDVF